MNYEKDISIDETALDIEWLRQPKLMLKYTNLVSDKRKDMDLLKENLDVLKADLDRQIRAHPEDFKVEKITEAVVQNTILTLDEYQEANEEYLNAKYEYDMGLNAVKALEQKKSSLENEVKLFLAGYFAGPKAPRDLSKEWEQKQRQEQSNDKVKTKLTRKD